MKLNKYFYFSVLGGIFTWLIMLIITPVNIGKITSETVLFIILSYLSLIFGYVIPRGKRIKFKEIELKKSYIQSFIILIVVTFIIRYLDLFLFRELSFYKSTQVNKFLSSKTNFNSIFVISAILKEVYFIPLILVFSLKSPQKKLIILAILLFLLPFPESILRGSRRIIFQSIFLLFFISFFMKKISITFKSGFFISVFFLLLFTLSTYLLFERETGKTENVYIHLIKNARHNELLMPKDYVVKYMENESNNRKSKKLILSAVQIGQYYTHGVFEFDYVSRYYKKQPLEKQYGKFTFFVIPKFLNSVGLGNYNLEKILKSSPREYTFISFFGGIYLDFGWFSLLFFFILGMIQKYTYQVVYSQHIIYYPLFIFLLFTNFFMLTFNFFRGTGTYALISCIIFIMIFEILLKRK